MKLTREETTALAEMTPTQQRVVNKIVALLTQMQDELYLERLRNRALLAPERTSQDDLKELMDGHEAVARFAAQYRSAPKGADIPHEHLRIYDFLGEDRGVMTKGEALRLAEIQQARFRAHGSPGINLGVICVHDNAEGPVGVIGVLTEEVTA